MRRALVGTAQSTGDRCPACRCEVVMVALEDEAEVTLECECGSGCALA